MCVVVLLIRVGVSGQRSLEAGEAALERGETLAAVASLRTSMGWYLPFAPWRGAAADRLWELHEAQVKAGDVPGAVQSLSALRSGIISTWGLVHTDTDELERVHGALPGLMAQWELDAAAEEGREVPGSLEERTSHYLDILRRETRPLRGWGVLALVGFGLWLIAAWRATERAAGARWRHLAASAGGLLLMLLGLWQA